jgi:N-formylglutamate deformylase
MLKAIPPAVVHIPHASQDIPPEILGSFVISPDAVRAELLLMTDHYTNELFCLPNEVATSIVFPVSRLVVDPERFVEDAREPMSAQGMGVVYTRTSDGRRLRPDSPVSLREELLRTYYFPHHGRLSRAVAAAIEKHGKCLLIDGHSFASSPLPHESDQRPKRPDICIGTDDFHTPIWLSELAVAIFREQGFEVDVNRPFAGTIVPEPFFRREPNVFSVMIEVNRSLYMVEKSGQRLPGFQAFAAVVQHALMQLIARATG